MHCWLFGIQRVAAGGGFHDFQPLLYLALSVTCLVAGACALRGGKNASTSAPLPAAFTAAGAAATGCVALLAGEPGFAPWAAVGLTALAGAAVGMHYLLWVDFYAKMDTRQMFLVVLLSVGVGTLIKPFFMFLQPGALSACMFALLPLASWASWRWSEGHVPPRVAEPAALHPQTLQTLRWYAVGVVAFGVAAGATRVLDSEYFLPTVASGLFSQLIELLLALALVVVVYELRENFDFSDMWALILVLIATGLLVLEFTDGAAAQAANAFFTAAQLFMYVFLLLAIVDVAQRGGYPSDGVYGVGYALYALPMALVSLGGNALGLGERRLSVLIMYVLLIAVYLFMRRRSYREPELFVGLALAAPVEADELSRALDAVAHRLGLSEREVEVVRLYAMGRSRAYIGGALCISENTVRGHIASVYKKAGIHGKQELIDLLQG